MGIFGKEANGDTQLQAIIAGLGEEVQQKALVQYYPPDSGRRPMWGLALLTQSTLHIVYGHGENWATRIIQSSTMEQETIAIPRDTIADVELPTAPTGIRRLFSGPTRVATVRTRDGDAVRLEIDDDGESLLRASRRHPGHGTPPNGGV